MVLSYHYIIKIKRPSGRFFLFKEAHFLINPLRKRNGEIEEFCVILVHIIKEKQSSYGEFYCLCTQVPAPDF